MGVTLKFGIPYCDFLGNCKFNINIDGKSIEELMEIFLTDHPTLVEKATERGYFINGKLKAIYTKNERIVLYKEVVSDGDIVGVFNSVVGG